MRNIPSIPAIVFFVALTIVVGGCKKTTPTVSPGAKQSKHDTPDGRKTDPCDVCRQCPPSELCEICRSCPELIPKPKTTAITLLCKYTKELPPDDSHRDDSQLHKCPSPQRLGDSWTVTPLGDVGTTTDASAIPTRMWCSYSYNGPRVDSSKIWIAQVERLAKTAGQMSCTEDKTHVVTLEDTVETPTGATASIVNDPYKQFTEHAGFLSPNLCSLISQDNPLPSPILVAVIDTAPTNRVTQKITLGATSAHGSMLATMIREFSGVVPTDPGSQGICAAEVFTVLALDTVVANDGSVQKKSTGGNSGTATSVAAAINEAVKIWKDGFGRHKLIINLSIGWEPTGFDEPTDHAVYDALMNAAINDDALIIAAAGNRPTKQAGKYEGLMYPAAYAAHSYPCLDANGVSIDGGCPLVIPISGVDLRGLPLASTRDKGRTLLVAPAQEAPGIAAHLDVADPPNAHWKPLWKPLTGSSVAAAVVSAKAANVWAKNPQLSGHLVMEMLWNDGDANPNNDLSIPNDHAAFAPIIQDSVVPDVCHAGVSYASCGDTAIPRVLAACSADNLPQEAPPGSCVTKASRCRCGAIESEPPITTPQPIPWILPNETVPPVVTQGLSCGPNHDLQLNKLVTDPAELTKEKICPEKVFDGYKWPPDSDDVKPLPSGCGCDDCSLVRVPGTSNFTLTVRVPSMCDLIHSPLISMTHTSTQATRTVGLPAGDWVANQTVVITGISITDYNLYNQAVVVGTDAEEETVIMDQIVY